MTPGFYPALFRPPGSRRCRLHISHFAAGSKARSLRRTVSPPLSTSLGQRAVLRNSGRTASTRLCRGRGGVRMPPRHQKGDTGRHRGNNGEKRRSRPSRATPPATSEAPVPWTTPLSTAPVGSYPGTSRPAIGSSPPSSPGAVPDPRRSRDRKTRTRSRHRRQARRSVTAPARRLQVIVGVDVEPVAIGI